MKVTQLGATQTGMTLTTSKLPEVFEPPMIQQTRKAPMREASNQRFGPVESCVDYHSYVYSIDPDFNLERYQATRRQLIKLGSTNEERMGVIYVRGPWGFYVIPQYGYPTLRVSFYHDTPTEEINDMLSLICAAFEHPEAIVNQGDLDE
jgi:hypothetical protein